MTHVAYNDVVYQIASL